MGFPARLFGECHNLAAWFPGPTKVNIVILVLHEPTNFEGKLPKGLELRVTRPSRQHKFLSISCLSFVPQSFTHSKLRPLTYADNDPTSYCEVGQSDKP